MASVELATAYISLVPTMKGSQGTIAKELSGVDGDGIGRGIGTQMGGGVVGALKGFVVAAAGMFAAGAVKDFATSAVSSFSELEDSSAAAGVVFGDSMGSIIAQSKTASSTLGLSSQQVISAANTYGTYGKAAGLAGKDLADFSTGFTGLASDMASFKGTSPEQAIEAVGAALRGETEPIRAYGVMLDDASMRQEALALGIISTTKDALTPQQKILAAQSLIYKQTGDAQGDFARTSMSTANVAKTLSAESENLSAKFGQVLAPAFTAVRVAALGAVRQMSGVLDRVIGFQAALAQGANTPTLVAALGLDPSTGFGLYVGEAIGGIRSFQAAFEAADGEITSSGFPGFMESFGYQTRLAFDGIKEAIGPAFAELKGGDFSSISAVWDGFLSIARPAGPIIVEVGKALGGMSQEIGKIIASGLPLIKPLLEGAAGVMQFLADNTGILTALIIALAAGMVVWRLAQIAGNIAALASVPVMAAQAASNFASAAANRSLAAAIAQSTLATTTNTVATGAGIGSRLAAIGSMIASRAAVIAGAAATGIAVAAQWAWNAAMSANPIGLVILAIVALVAGLVWFFTQTELGRAIFQSVFQFIQATVAGVLGWFTGTLIPTFSMVWNMVRSGLAGLGSFFADTWSNIVNGVSGMIGNVTGFFGGLIGKITGAIGNAGSALFSVGVNIIQGLINGIGSMMGAIGRAVLSIVPEAIRGPFEQMLGIRSPSRVFMAYGVNIGQGLINGLDGMHGKIASSVEGMVTVPSTPAYGSATAAGDYRTMGGFGQTYNIYETDDPIATAHAVSRRQTALAV